MRAKGWFRLLLVVAAAWLILAVPGGRALPVQAPPLGQSSPQGEPPPWARVLLALGMPTLVLRSPLPQVQPWRPGSAFLGVAAFPPNAAHPPNARPPYPQPPPPDVYGSAPVVAIYHTASTQAYRPALRARGLGDGSALSTDQAVGVVQVGAVLAQSLYRWGVAAVHSRAVNDPDGMLGAYENAWHTVRSLLTAYPTVRVLLDVGRALPSPPGTVAPPAGATAPVRLVVGTEDGLTPPRWRENLAFAHMVAAAAHRLYPSWPVRVVLSPGAYNQGFLPGALLVEVGDADTPLESADRAAQRLARVLAQLAAGGLLPPPARVSLRVPPLPP